MTQITTKELYEMLAKSLCENERIYNGDDFKAIHLNGITIYYTHYKVDKDSLEDNDFYIHFFDNDGICCIFCSYETEYIYFNYNMYKIF